MSNIGRDSKANSRDNEDFSFTDSLGPIRLLIVGDFAQSGYAGKDAATTNELEHLMKDTTILAAANTSIELLLAQLACKLNTGLFNFAQQSRDRFQCSVVLAAIIGADLYYLSIGDCRIAVFGEGMLHLLNGTVWEDPSGSPLPLLIELTQKVHKVKEPPPDHALGVPTDVDIVRGRVVKSSLRSDDLVLLYSDGVDKFVSPVRMLQLLTERTAEESLQTLVDRILDEVRIEHGDDDRTLLIAAGPYIRTEDAATEESRQKVEKLAEDVTNVAERINTLAARVSNEQTLHASLLSIEERLKEVQTVQQTRTVGGEGVSGDTLRKIFGSLNSLQEAVSNIQTTIRGGGRGKQHGKNAHQQPSNTTPQDSGEIAVSAQPALKQLQFDHPFREGLLKIENAFYELVDENSVLKTDTYWIPAGNVRPGWLTAFNLYLRAQPIQDWKDKNKPSLEIWIERQLPEGAKALDKVPTEELLRLRGKHWDLRDKRKRSWPFYIDRDELIREERMLAASLFTVADVAEERLDARVGPGSGDTETIKDALRDPKMRALLVVVVVVVLILVAWTLTSPGTKPAAVTQTSSASATDEAVTLQYGGDGRTLFAVDQHGNQKMLQHRILFGKENEFKALFPNPEFKSLDLLRDKIEKDAHDLVTTKGPRERNDVTVTDVISDDVENVSSSGNQKCDRFLKRVNRTLSGPGRNKIDDLLELNPGLKCGDLKVGNKVNVLKESTGAGNR